MKQERFEQANELLSEYCKEKEINSLIGFHSDTRPVEPGNLTLKDALETMLKVHTTPHSKEVTGLTLPGLNKNSDTVKKLEEAGFKVVYPAELTEQAVENLDEVEKYTYDKLLGTALVIDGNEENLSLDFANTISSHYFSTGDGVWSAVGTENNSITECPHGQFVDGSSDRLNELLTNLGFRSQVAENGDVTVSSDIPYPVVKKSKFRQLYDLGKDKISSAFAKLKSFFAPKDQVKEDDQDEREWT